MLWLASPSVSQEKSFTASLQGSLGGALGADEPDPGLGNLGFHLGFSWVVQPQTNVVARAGRIDFSDRLETVLDPELTYVTIGGEYTYQESYYKSGVYLGVGIYNLEGRITGDSFDDTSVGVVLGITGDFPITAKFSFVAELSAHYADLDTTQFFGFLHAGLAFHF